MLPGTPSRRSAVGQFLFVGRLNFLSVFRTFGWSWSSSAFFSADSTCWIGVGARRSVGPSYHSDWLFSWRTRARERRRTDVLLGRRVSSTNGLVCQGNFGPRRCRREPTLQSAFVATSSSAWCVPGFLDPQQKHHHKNPVNLRVSCFYSRHVCSSDEQYIQ